MSTKIPCTVAILTRNSGSTLARALKSVVDFAEIIVCDGGSTDDTLAIAQTYGARVIPQDSQYCDAQGRLTHWAGVRNQTLSAASYQWFLFLDSDEYLSPQVVEEIRQASVGKAAAYWVPRKFEYQGKIIDCAVTYPSVQMRFFSRHVTNRFIKEVHEKIELKESITPATLNAYMVVPLPERAEELHVKWCRYLSIEKERRAPTSFVQWIRIATHELGVGGLYLLRLLRIRLFCRGTKLPVRFELARVWYQWALVKDSFSAIAW